MLSEERKQLRALLIKHEGLRLKLYVDTVGKRTIGVGRNLDDTGVSELEAMLMLSNDIVRVQNEAVLAFPWFQSISAVRQDVILSMVFNLGLERLKGFQKMLGAIQVGQFESAADEMLNSTWAGQVGLRAQELAQMMRQGAYPHE